MFRTRQLLRAKDQVQQAHEDVSDTKIPLTVNSLIDITNPEYETPAEQAAPTVIGTIYQDLTHVAEAIYAHNNNRPLNADIVMEALKKSLDTFQQIDENGNYDDSLLTEAIRRRTQDTSLARRTTGTTLLALRLGLEIGFDERRCIAIGLCGLMHDLGMQTIPEEVLNSPKWTPEQLQLMQQHPLESRKIIEAFGDEFSWVGEVVSQVHERYDGSGYPARIEGEEIHEFARIIGLADTYEAMSHARPDRKAVIIYNVLSQIIDVRNKAFDPNLIKALIKIVSIFPLGSLVQLNNGAIGRVIGANKLYPTRPLLELSLDPQGHPLKSATFVNLEDDPMLTIVEPAVEESVLTNK